MGAPALKHEETPSPHTAADTPFDKAIRQHFALEPEPDDGGFSQAVMAALPQRVVQRRARLSDWVRRAHWAAISLASCIYAVLTSGGGSAADTAQLLAGYTLIALLAFWSIPSRWSRG